MEKRFAYFILIGLAVGAMVGMSVGVANGSLARASVAERSLASL